MNGLKELISYLTNQFKFWFIVKEWENGLQLRNGKIKRQLSHGIYFRLPFIDSVYVKPIRTMDIVISQANFTTKDEKQVTASATAFFKINNIKDYYNGYAEPFSIIDGIIKNEMNKYLLSIDYSDFNIVHFQDIVLEKLKEIKGKGMKFENFKLITLSNARTYRLITDKLYSQTEGRLDEELY